MTAASAETVARFDHDGVAHELDHLGIGHADQWGRLAIYADGTMMGEFAVEFPAAASGHACPELPDADVLIALARHELAVDAGAPDRMTLRTDNRKVMAAWCGGHEPADLGSDVLLVDKPEGRAVVALRQTVERTETGFRKVSTPGAAR